MTERENILRFIGLAKRAGKLESGTDGVIKALRTGRAKLLIAASDVSPRTLQKVTESVTYEIPMYRFATMDELGTASGSPPRGILAVTDNGFAEGLDKKLTDYEEDDN